MSKKSSRTEQAGAQDRAQPDTNQTTAASMPVAEVNSQQGPIVPAAPTQEIVQTPTRAKVVDTEFLPEAYYILHRDGPSRADAKYTAVSNRMEQHDAAELLLSVAQPDTLEFISTLGAICTLRGYKLPEPYHLHDMEIPAVGDVAVIEATEEEQSHTLGTLCAIANCIAKHTTEPISEVMQKLLQHKGNQNG